MENSERAMEREGSPIVDVHDPKKTMASATRPPGFPDPTSKRRVVTAPAPLQPVSQGQFIGGPNQSGNGLVETLYNHPSVKIIAFTAGPRTFSATFSPGRGFAAPPEVEPGTLPWSSQIERTIAVGPFRIYRAPGSVAFLSCGTALQPILPKSQCWCIDEISSKFVLQIRRPQYWRIEIPVAAGGADGAESLRNVFDKVLQFEKTPCPFQRAFTVELPERPQTPIKKRPWTPVRKTSVQLPPTPITPEDLTPRPMLFGRRRNSFSKLAEKWSDKSSDNSGSPSDDLQTPTLPVIEKIRREEAERTEGAQETKRGDKDTSGSSQGYESGPALLPAIPRHAAGFSASRCVTAPPQLSLVTPQQPSSQLPPVKPATATTEFTSTETSATNSPTDSSSDSFHSLQSWHSPITPLPPSPPLSHPSSPKTFPYPHDNVPLPGREDPTAAPPPSIFNVISPTGATDGTNSNDASPVEEQTAEDEVAPSISSLDEGSVKSFDKALQEQEPDGLEQQQERGRKQSQGPSTPRIPTSPSSPLSLGTSNSEPRPRLRHRTTTGSISSVSGHHRALSPLPPAANIITTPHRKFRPLADSQRAKTRLEAVRRIPSAIIHKTCEILLSPPGHLISLMLKVAARITAGEWRGFVFGVGESGERIPVHWDLSDGGSDSGSASPWDLHDYRDDLPENADAGRTSSRSSAGPAEDRALGGADEYSPRESLPGDWDQSWEVD